MRRHHRELGVTLVELMIAMVIGLVILAAVGSVYISARSTARSNEIIARMQENGRFALDLLADHLVHAGYFGVTLMPTFIDRRKTSGTPVPPVFRPANDCEDDWYIDLDRPLQALPGAASGAQPFASTCLAPDLNTRYRADSDLLVVRTADTRNRDSVVPPEVPFEPGKLYVRGDFAGGVLFAGSEAPPAATLFAGEMESHEIYSAIYFAGEYREPGTAEFKPYLLRETTVDAGVALGLETQALYPGIEQLQIQLGVDRDGDCDVDFWQGPGVAGNEPMVSAVRLWILVRSEEPESAGYLNTNSYTLGDYTYEFDDDRFMRIAMSRTIKLRNINKMRPDLTETGEVYCQ